MGRRVAYELKVITVIFKDGTTGTFEHCISHYENDGYYDIFFTTDEETKIMYVKYSVDDVATIVNGYVDVAI